MKVDPLRIVSDGIVAHWKYFSTMYRLRWYGRSCVRICRALTFALARLSCIYDFTELIPEYSVVFVFLRRQSSPILPYGITQNRFTKTSIEKQLVLILFV